MKTLKILSIIFILTQTSYLMAQTSIGACGTNMSEEQKDWLSRYQRNPELYSFGNRSIIYVPIQIHIVGDDNGDGYYKIDDLFQTICNLNNDFSSADMYFYMDGEVNYINNSEYYDHDYNTGYSMMRDFNVDNRVNIYFVNTPNEGNCGYFTDYGDAVAISKTCQGSDGSTLTHELGHFFNLPHTFFGWEGRTYEDDPISNNKQERVDGSNCKYAGDGFCDTPPDYISSRWSCPYNKNYTDPLGGELDIDGSLFMSYSDDNCQSRFSTEQIAAMKANINDIRRDLLRDVEPEIVDSFDEVTIIRPLQNSYNTPYNYATFLWDKIDNATGYHVMVSRFNTFNNPVIDTVVTDNYLEVFFGLDEGRMYRWKVNPIGVGNTCSQANSDGIEFYASEFQTIDDSWKNQYESIDEFNSIKKLVLYPSILNGNQNISFYATTTLVGKAQLRVFNLSGQLVKNESITINKGTNQFYLNLTNGMFEVQIIKEQDVFRNKVLVL